MDEHFLQNSFDLQLPSPNLSGNYTYVSHLAENTISQQHLIKPEDYDNYFYPQWIGYQHLAPNYVDYLLGNEISNVQGEIPYGSSGTGCSFTPKESFLGMDVHPAEPNPYVRLSRKEYDEVPVSDYIKPQHKICYQQIPNEVQHQLNMSTSTSETPSKSRKNRSRGKAYESDRRRRIRIKAALDALDDLLPRSNEDKTNVVDDCIDYIKYLQRHMRELSQNRLGGEPTSNPLMYLEGFGHYLVHENTATGPMQDMLVKLLNENPSDGTRFLESLGLFMMPIAPN